MTELVRLSLSLEQPLFRRLEEMARESNYENRSAFVRDLIRTYLVEQAWEKNEEALGTITLVYNHHARCLNEKLTAIQHKYHHHVLATTHIHLDHDLCAEMIMAKGKAGEIKALCDKMKQVKGVLHATLAISSTGKKLA
jgi:CopG family nickel-responsive transcriptional regulator